MTPETAEIAIAEQRELAAAAAGTSADASTLDAERSLAARSPAARSPAARWLADRVDAERVVALREVWRALWVSRLLVWAAAAVAVLGFGVLSRHAVFDPPRLTSGFGWLGDLLAAPAARWDAVWYLVIAHYGYHPELGVFTASRAAFFPLYPLALRGLSDTGVPAVLAGVLISTAAFAAALYGIHRLSALEASRLLGERSGGESATGGRSGVGSGQAAEVARWAVLATALAPMAFYFSAVYSESLYLALSVGVFWCARRGRWAWAGTLGALASATRSAGVVLLVPVAILYLYGPREDRPPDLQPRWRYLRVRHRPRGDALWLAALPLGVVAYAAYFALAGGDPLQPFHAQEVWARQFAGPYVAVWDGARAALDGARQLLSMQRAHVYFAAAGGDPTVAAEHNLLLFAFLAAAAVGLVGVLRRLPLAYGAYVLAALALPLSYPVAAQPLMSLPRFEVVLFPLFMWLGAALAERPRARLAVLGGSALLMAFFAGQFATWHWVA